MSFAIIPEKAFSNRYYLQSYDGCGHIRCSIQLFPFEKLAYNAVVVTALPFHIQRS